MSTCSIFGISSTEDSELSLEDLVLDYHTGCDPGGSQSLWRRRDQPLRPFPGRHAVCHVRLLVSRGAPLKKPRPLLRAHGVRAQRPWNFSVSGRL